MQIKIKMTKDHVKNGVVLLDFVKSAKNLADPFTKSLSRALVMTHRGERGLSL